MSLNVLRSRIFTTASSRLCLLSSHFNSNRLSGPTSPSTISGSTFSSNKRTMSSLPSTMKAVLLTETGGTDKLRYSDSEPLPKLTDGQILVKNNIAGINFIDTYFRTGLYPAPAGYPMILGQEGAGTVAATSGSTELKEGDRVAWIKVGGYAEYTAVAADRAVKIPEGLSDEDAVGGFLMGMTALSLIKEAYEVKKGDKILVHAAAGGMGLLLCQLLKDAGAYTIGTASTQEKMDLAKQNGADVMINYKENEKWVEEVKKLTDGKGVDAVYDSVGKTTWDGSLESVKRNGKVVFWGSASGPIPPLNIARLAQKNTSIMRSTLMNYIVTREELEHYANMAMGLVRDRKLNIKIHKVYDLKDAAQAQDDLEGRGTTGKLLLKC